jgi:hypothetical protein
MERARKGEIAGILAHTSTRHTGPGGEWSGPRSRYVWTGDVQATRTGTIWHVSFGSDGPKSSARLDT